MFKGLLGSGHAPPPEGFTFTTKTFFAQSGLIVIVLVTGLGIVAKTAIVTGSFTVIVKGLVVAPAEETWPPIASVKVAVLVEGSIGNDLLVVLLSNKSSGKLV